MTLFLAVVMLGIFLYENEGVREKLVGSFKAKIAPELDLSQDTGLDLSELNLGVEQEIQEKNEELRDEELSSSFEGQQEEEEEEKLTLEQIKEKLDEIEEKKNQIEKEVKKLKVLVEIQEDIKELSEKIVEISKEVNNLT